MKLKKMKETKIPTAESDDVMEALKKESINLMDWYQRVEKPKPETPINENEVRITTQRRMRNYITYATTLLQEKGFQEMAMSLAHRSHNSSKQDSRINSLDCHGESRIEKGGASTDVITDLELKIPGSTAIQVHSGDKLLIVLRCRNQIREMKPKKIIFA